MMFLLLAAEVGLTSISAAPVVAQCFGSTAVSKMSPLYKYISQKQEKPTIGPILGQGKLDVSTFQ